ncbi:MAG: AAA family ATPase [Candidatus Micrarchaeota archaeon]|nr:AAA family ATPase [Candidatus Micrarchaeota archaeon]
MEVKLIAKVNTENEYGIVKINPSVMKQLKLDNGDYVEIIGKKYHYALVFGDKHIREDTAIIDSIGLKNLQVEENDIVNIKSIKNIKICKKAIIVPKEHISFDHNVVLKNLRGFAIYRSINVGFFEEQEKKIHMFYVLETDPQEPCVMSETTSLVIKSRLKNNFEGVIYEDIGGLKKQLKQIREIIEIQLLHPEIFNHLGIKMIKGILLHGPPGTGKTLLAKAIATETNAFFIGINAPELLSKYVGESEENLKRLFKLAKENSPSIIFIDEIDAIAQKRDDSSEVERRLVAELLTLMDGLETTKGIIVIGATNRIDSIDDALRRPGRFDKEIEIPIPDEESRKEILEIHTRNMPLTKDVDVNELAKLCYGFSGADIEALCKEASMIAINKLFDKNNPFSYDTKNYIKVSMQDFIEALKMIEPSALREITRELPYATWNDFGGMKETLNEIKSVIEFKLSKSKQLHDFGLEIPKGILLYGPSGTGKTLLARIIAHNIQANFVYVSCTALLSKYVGESEKLVRRIFAKARNTAPCIVFLDSIDSLLPKHKSILQQISDELDNLKEDVIVIAATNKNKERLPHFITAEHKFGMHYEFKLPDINERKEIIQIYLRKIHNHNIDIDELSKLTKGFSGAMIKALITKAVINTIRDNKPNLEYQMIKEILTKQYGVSIEPTTSHQE